MNATTSPTSGVANVPVLVQVVTRAGRRCECTRRGCHGRAERCERAMPGIQLNAAPRDHTVPMHQAWRAPVAELAAWCGRCFEQAQADGRRDRAAALARRLEDDALPLPFVAPTAGQEVA